jgi:hypothetical protein
VHTLYVPVRNEITGEVRVVEILASYHVDAQVEALHLLFREEGWRSARALRPYTAAQEATA